MKVDKYEIMRVGGGTLKVAMGILWAGMTLVLVLGSVVFDNRR